MMDILLRCGCEEMQNGDLPAQKTRNIGCLKSERQGGAGAVGMIACQRAGYWLGEIGDSSAAGREKTCEPESRLYE